MMLRTRLHKLPAVQGRRMSASLRGRPRHVSQGQALVETAMIITILFLLVVGATDIATLLDDHLNLVYASRQGARTASVMGNQADADCVTINAVRAALSDATNITLNQIVIYKAGTNGLPGSSPTEDVYAGSTTCTITAGGTTTYTPAPCGTCIGYPPKNRNNTAIYEDSIGVELDFTYHYQFQVFGTGTLSAADRAVMPIEPVGVPSPNPTPTPLKP